MEYCKFCGKETETIVLQGYNKEVCIECGIEKECEKWNY